MKHTQSRPYPKAEHLGNPFVVGSLTDHQTGGNLTCSGRPFRRISPYLLSDDRDYILPPHGSTPHPGTICQNNRRFVGSDKVIPTFGVHRVDTTFHVCVLRSGVGSSRSDETYFWLTRARIVLLRSRRRFDYSGGVSSRGMLIGSLANRSASLA